jgi:hypothetical protein
MSMSDYLENIVLNLTLRNTAYAQPATVYVALHTADPTDAGTGAEVTGGAYARQAIAFNAAAGGSITGPTADITFPTATANWGTITHFSIRDAATGGNQLFHGPLANSKVIQTGDIFKFLSGSISVAIN